MSADHLEIKLTKLESEVSTLSRDITDLTSSMRSIDNSLKSLVLLEEKTNQVLRELQKAAEQANDHEDRIRNIEAEMPGLKLVSKYAIAGAVAVLAAVVGSLLKLIGLETGGN